MSIPMNHPEEIHFRLRNWSREPLSVLLGACCDDLPEGTSGHDHGDFETDLYIHPIGKRKWDLTRDLVFVHPKLGRVVVPAGFIFDGYSIPWTCRAVYQNMEGREDAAAAVHDYLRRFYKTIGISVYQCDTAFRDAMEALDVPPRTRNIKFAVVAVAGYFCPPPGDGTGGPVRDKGVGMKKVLTMVVLAGVLALTGCMTKMVIGQAETLAKQQGWMQLPATGGGTVWLGPEMAKHYRTKQAEARALYVSAVDRKEALSALLAMDDYLKADPAHGIDEYQMADNLLPIRMMFARGFDYILLPGGIAYGLYEAADSLSSSGSSGRYKTVEVNTTQGDNSRVNIQTGSESGYKEGQGFNTLGE